MMHQTSRLVYMILVYTAFSVSLFLPGVASASASELLGHDPILIVGDSSFTPENGVTGGTGTSMDPYLIEDWRIEAVSANTIEIRNTTAVFVVRNVLLHHSRVLCCEGDVIVGVLLVSVANGQVLESTIANDIGSFCVQGIRIVDSANVVVAGNSVSMCCEGIDVEVSYDITIQDNSIVRNTDGIVFTHSEFINVVGNNVSDNSNHGIDPIRSSRIVISDNILLSNTENTIGAFNSSSVLVSNNIIEYSHYGGNALGIYGGEAWTVQGNLISENSNGITVLYASNVTISNNTLSENFDGFDSVSSDVSIYHNNVVNNTYQAFSFLSGARWDDGYPSGGNFWSDYTGSDNCSGADQITCNSPDGLGDLPRVSDTLYGSVTRDNYPLMKPFAGSVTGRLAFQPGTIPSKSSGRFLTAYVGLPSELRVSNIVPSSIRVNDAVRLADGMPVIVGMRGFDRTQVLTVKFALAELKTLLPKPGDYHLTITGNIVTGTLFRQFSASTTVRLR